MTGHQGRCHDDAPKTEHPMTRSIGTPRPDCSSRAQSAAARRAELEPLANGRGSGVTTPNGEEIDYGLGFAGSYHKALPHDIIGQVDCASYHDLVRILSGHEIGAIETLPIGRNRSGAGTPTDPQRYTDTPNDPLGYRKLTSPFTGHVFDTEGADAGALAISPAPRFDTDELAAEMAELYAMALLRDVPFTHIDDGTGDNVSEILTALQTMNWLNGTDTTTSSAQKRRFDTKGVLSSSQGLFRGSTPGSKAGPWMSQFLLGGHDNGSFTFAPDQSESPGPEFRGTRARIGEEDGFVLYGTQIIDQRSVVAIEGKDYMTNWASWLDCQNGVDFNHQDVFRPRRRFLHTPRDITTYVHYDALYQAYLVACLRMLGDGAFKNDRGMPESDSRTRSAFASFGGPHVLALLPEVSSRALKAVWRQKWLHHRRTRPEVVAAWLTLRENEPDRITDPTLVDALTQLRAKIPQPLLDLVAAHNTAQNGSTTITPKADVPADFPDIADDKNFLLPQAFPEGSPTHPAYGAGHATVAGACVTVLKAFFEMYEADGTTERVWPKSTFVATWQRGGVGGTNAEGGELVPAPGDPSLTLQQELDKLAMNIAHARNMAGVHYYTDYFESLRLGERVATSILEEQLSMYGEAVSMSFTSFDGDRITVRSNGGTGEVLVDTDGQRVSAQSWYDRYSS